MLNLLVICVKDIEQSKTFYETFSFQFEKHKHGKGLPHFASISTKETEVTLKLYPSDGKSTIDVRLGFQVTNIAETIRAITSYGGTVISAPKESMWGKRAVVTDVDGYKVELCEIPSKASSRLVESKHDNLGAIVNTDAIVN